VLATLAYLVPFEFERAALVASWVVLLPAAILLDRALARLRDEPRFASLAAIVPKRRWAAWTGAFAWALAAGQALLVEIRPWDLRTAHQPNQAFTDERALVGALLAASALAAARWLDAPMARRTAVIAVLATLAYLVPFEVRPDLVAVLWVALAGGALVAAAWDAAGPVVFRGIASGLTALAAAVAFVVVAEPDRLWVADPAFGRAPLLPAWTLGLGAVAIALAVASRLAWLQDWRRPLEVATGATALYLASIAVVDVFQRQVGGTVATEELAKQAQVGLSILWTATGFVSLASGVVREHPLARQAGFVLLAVATAKVFVIDLASMDVAYRAIVFAALGVLLLMGAALLGRFRGPRAGSSGLPGQRVGHA
jgi:uncharacterized membrane protein